MHKGCTTLRATVVLALLTAPFHSVVAQEPGHITTVAGSFLGFSGDSGPATKAELFWPASVYVDAWGSIYVADYGNARIRMVDAGGTITTLAGNGFPDFSGDGNAAVAASLFTPSGIAADDNGNLFIADTGHNRIRWVDARDGLIHTIAGDGTFGFLGDDIPATSSALAEPADVVLDGEGDLYISDTKNHRIRHIDAKGIITTVAGTGEGGYALDGWPAKSAKLDEPGGIFLTRSMELYVADTKNHRIRRIDLNTGIITSVAGNGEEGFAGDGGPATEASFSHPWDVSLDSAGNIYIADTHNNRIRRVDADTGIITTVAGNGNQEYVWDDVPATETPIDHPRSVFVDRSGTYIYIADTLHHRIRRVTLPAETVALSADFDSDGSIDVDDLAVFAQHFGSREGHESYGIRFDLDRDGVIAFRDFVLFARMFTAALVEEG